MVPTHFIPVSTFLLKKERGFAMVSPGRGGRAHPTRVPPKNQCDGNGACPPLRTGTAGTERWIPAYAGMTEKSRSDAACFGYWPGRGRRRTVGVPVPTLDSGSRRNDGQGAGQTLPVLDTGLGGNDGERSGCLCPPWIPAFAGMTDKGRSDPASFGYRRARGRRRTVGVPVPTLDSGLRRNDGQGPVRRSLFWIPAWAGMTENCRAASANPGFRPAPE